MHKMSWRLLPCIRVGCSDPSRIAQVPHVTNGGSNAVEACGLANSGPRKPNHPIQMDDYPLHTRNVFRIVAKAVGKACMPEALWEIEHHTLVYRPRLLCIRMEACLAPGFGHGYGGWLGLSVCVCVCPYHGMTSSLGPERRFRDKL